MNIVVRPVLPADYAQWRLLFDGYNAFYGLTGDSTLPHAVVDACWSRLLDEAEPMHGLVAEDHGRLVGLAHFLFHRSTSELQPVCYLEDLYASPDARGHGVGRRLTGEVFREAAHRRASVVYWKTQATNERAIRLYSSIGERTGFVVYSRRL